MTGPGPRGMSDLTGDMPVDFDTGPNTGRWGHAEATPAKVAAISAEERILTVVKGKRGREKAGAT